MQRVFTGAAMLLTLALGSFAQNQPPRPAVDDETAAMRITRDAVPSVKARSNTAAASRAYTSSDWEVWRNITIAPGQIVTLHSDIDFATADAARVSIRSRNNDLPDVRMDAYWSVPQAEFFNVAEVASGNTFPYRNVGGVTFTTYGNQFRLRLTNVGGTTIFLSQVVVFARVL